MKTRYFALILGVLYVATGVLSAIPKLQKPYSRKDPKLKVKQGSGYWLGMFPVNIVHSALHVVTGLLGIASYASARTSRLFAQAMTVLFAPMAVMGLLPDKKFNTMFGMAPLWGPDTLVHAGTALASGYFGFLAPFGGRVPSQFGNTSNAGQTRSYLATTPDGVMERRTVPAPEPSRADPFGTI